jgi:hypothetical protein
MTKYVISATNIYATIRGSVLCTWKMSVNKTKIPSLPCGVKTFLFERQAIRLTYE